MCRNVQILILCLYAVPWLSGAAEETMEDRKRRIARKYLRERADITYSEEQVPGDAPALGEEALLAAELLNQVPEKIEREELSAQPYRPMPARRPSQQAENPNWLLAEPSEQVDSYANPFALEGEGEELEEDTWSFRDPDPSSSQYNNTQREGDFYRGQSEAGSRPPASSFDVSGQQSAFGRRLQFEESSQAENPTQQGRQPLGRYDRQGQENLFPSTSSQALPYSTQNLGSESGEDPSGGSRYWSSTPNKSPYETQQLQSQWGSYTPYQSSFQEQREQRQQQWGSYTPYQSSFQEQREQRQQQWGSYTPYQSSYDAQQQWGGYSTEQGYERKDAYEAWKKRNALQYDPTSADSYTQEMMPQTRR